jgi:hypothetical protein
MGVLYFLRMVPLVLTIIYDGVGNIPHIVIVKKERHSLWRPITCELKEGVVVRVGFYLVDVLMCDPHNVMGQIHYNRRRQKVNNVNPVRSHMVEVVF